MKNPSISSPTPSPSTIQAKGSGKAKPALAGGLPVQLPDYDSLRRYDEHLRLRGRAGRTREEYMRYARKLAELALGDPATLEEAQVRSYFLHLKEVRKYAPSSLRLAVAALRFFFNDFLERGWKLFSLIRVPQPRTLPEVLSREEVHRLLATVREPRYRMLFELIYGCGLRRARNASRSDAGRCGRSGEDRSQ